MTKNKSHNHYKQIIIENGKVTKEVISCYDDYKLRIGTKWNSSVEDARNRTKLIRLYINGKEQGYVLLDKLNRNLHIEGDIKNLKTNY